MNALISLEKQLAPLAPRFAEVLGNAMPVERLMRTVLISVERQPALLECDRQSLFNGAMTFAVLALEVDGVTGQGFLVPFNDRKRGIKIVQPIIGYKGFNTLGARSGLTIGGAVVREGDEFDYDEGSRAFVHHKKKLGGETERRVIAAWTTATCNERPALIKILSIDELLAIKKKSPRGLEPPWADPTIGFPAMCEKSAKRRLARDMPLNVFQVAARMEEAFEEQGKPAWISADRNVVIDGEIMAPKHSIHTPSAQELTAPQPDLIEWRKLLAASAARGTEELAACWKTLPRAHQAALKHELDNDYKIIAANADAEDLSGKAQRAKPDPEAGATAPSHPVDSRDGTANELPATVAADLISAARQRGRDDRARGTKRSATPLEYRAPDRTAEAFAWVEGWSEKTS